MTDNPYQLCGHDFKISALQGVKPRHRAIKGAHNMQKLLK
jgi:hypothetical protein